MYCIVLYFKTMDSSKVSLSLCGENLLYIGSSIAHHCNFTTLRNATGAHITTRKAYGTVFDENMFFPHSNLTDVVELEVADRKPAVLVLQSSSVDITVLKEKRLSYNEMAKAAKKSSTDIFTLAVKMSAYPFLKRIIVSERTPELPLTTAPKSTLAPTVCIVAQALRQSLCLAHLVDFLQGMMAGTCTALTAPGSTQPVC